MSSVNYWGLREEQLVIAWLNANTPKEQWRVHWDLEPKVLHMARQILFRYHSRTDNYITQEACDHAMLSLRSHFKPEKGIKAYSYCQTIIRNYLLDTIVPDNRYEHQSLQEYPDLAEEIVIAHENVMEDCLDIEQRILRRFKQLKAKDEQRLLTSLKTGTTLTISDCKLYLRYIEKAIEAIERFGASITLRSLAEYCMNELQFTEGELCKCTIHYHEYSLLPTTLAKKIAYKERKENKPEKYTPMEAWLKDDVCPNDYFQTKYRSCIMRANNKYRTKQKD